MLVVRVLVLANSCKADQAMLSLSFAWFACREHLVLLVVAFISGHSRHQSREVGSSVYACKIATSCGRFNRTELADYSVPWQRCFPLDFSGASAPRN